MVATSTFISVLAIYLTSTVNAQRRQIGEANFLVDCINKQFVAENAFFAPTLSSLDSDCFNIPSNANGGVFTAVEPHSMSNACLDRCITTTYAANNCTPGTNTSSHTPNPSGPNMGCSSVPASRSARVHCPVACPQ